MQTIVFTTTEAGQCLDECKIIPGIKIGSHTCTHCVNCLAFDSVENTVKCNESKENMTKQEAYEAMQQGNKVRHENYSPEEYVFINEKGNFQTEDGYDHGGIYGEFWGVYQRWESGWSIHEEK